MTRPGDSPPASLLDDPVLVIEVVPGQTVPLSLPGVLARLLTHPDPIRTFPGLAAEQFSHWYRFLVRCATRALRDDGIDEALRNLGPAKLEDRLREGLLEAGGSGQAWLLHHPDPHRPAFLQAPVPDHARVEGPVDAGYSERGVAMLTALMGSKNFERKSEAVRSLSAAALVYCLVEFQSGVIFGGRGNYETQLTPSRSGKGSGVPFMALRLPEGLGASFQRDVALFAADEKRIRDNLKIDGDTWALWTEPWDGERTMSSTELDPAFIPMARMIRIGTPDEDGRFSRLWFRTSSGSRVLDISDGALYGDPFTPTILHSDGHRKVRGVMEDGFRYPEVAELLGFGGRGMQPSRTVEAFFEERGADRRPGIELVLDGVAFEQGKTLGFYRRILPLPTGGGGWLGEVEPFRNVHGRMLAKMDDAKKILRASARILVTGEPRPRKGDEALAAMPTNRLDDFAEDGDAYLQALFDFGGREATGDHSWESEWEERVSEWARRAFHDALPLLVAPTGQRIRREADALNHLEGRLWKLRGGKKGESGDAETHTNEETAA